jgi:hypothetical protein
MTSGANIKGKKHVLSKKIFFGIFGEKPISINTLIYYYFLVSKKKRSKSPDENIFFKKKRSVKDFQS